MSRTRSAKLMRFRIWIAGSVDRRGGFGAARPRGADSVTAVEPGGPGVLTKCRDWLVASSCKTYKHIPLPARIAVGDTITVSFGSSPKEFAFSVARIALKGGHCAIFSEADGDRHEMDKINVAPCYPARHRGAEECALSPQMIPSARSASTSRGSRCRAIRPGLRRCAGPAAATA